MKVIGLTGGICSGKSTIAKYFETLGARIVDADKLGHAAYTQGTTCYEKLKEHFGMSIISEDAAINRKALGDIVFSDPSQMRQLENIVWPEIKAMIEQRVTEEKNEEGLMIIEAAIAIEAGWTELFDKLIVVSVDRDTAIERLQSRNGLSYDDALKRLNAQMTNDERCSKADVIIENSIENSLEQIQLKVQEIFASLSN